MTTRLEDDYAEFHDGDVPLEELLSRSKRYQRFWREPSRLPLAPVRVLVGVEWKAPYFVGVPTQMFRLKGLLVSRAPAGTRLDELSVGADIALPTSLAPVWLSTLTLIETLDAETRGQCPARPHYPSCSAGTQIRIRLSHPKGELDPNDVELTLWGEAARYL